MARLEETALTSVVLSVLSASFFTNTQQLSFFTLFIQCCDGEEDGSKIGYAVFLEEDNDSEYGFETDEIVRQMKKIICLVSRHELHFTGNVPGDICHGIRRKGPQNIFDYVKQPVSTIRPVIFRLGYGEFKDGRKFHGGKSAG